MILQLLDDVALEQDVGAGLVVAVGRVPRVQRLGLLLLQQALEDRQHLRRAEARAIVAHAV